MEIETNVISTTRPHETIVGPTRIGVASGIEQVTVHNDEENTDGPAYRFDRHWLTPGEYNLIRAGQLPPEAEWDAVLRRIERSALLDAADVRIAEAEDYIATETAQARVDEWTEYREAVREYKQAVRATVNGKGFPVTASYPEEPIQPID